MAEMGFSHVGTSLEEVGKGWASLPVIGQIWGLFCALRQWTVGVMEARQYAVDVLAGGQAKGQRVWESGCLDDGLIRMTDSAADTVSSVEEPESSTRMVWCTALVGRQWGYFCAS